MGIVDDIRGAIADHVARWGIGPAFVYVSAEDMARLKVATGDPRLCCIARTPIRVPSESDRVASLKDPKGFLHFQTTKGGGCVELHEEPSCNVGRGKGWMFVRDENSGLLRYRTIEEWYAQKRDHDWAGLEQRRRYLEQAFGGNLANELWRKQKEQHDDKLDALAHAMKAPIPARRSWFRRFLDWLDPPISRKPFVKKRRWWHRRAA